MSNCYVSYQELTTFEQLEAACALFIHVLVDGLYLYVSNFKSAIPVRHSICPRDELAGNVFACWEPAV